MFCLAMMYEGATGETRQAIADVLEISGLDHEDRQTAIVRLKSALQMCDRDVQLLIGNSLWCNRDIPVRPDYLARMSKDYGAQVESLDFSDAASVSRINAWVEENTRGKIDGIIDHISALDLLIAINAIYFKGLWTRPFDRNATRDDSFTTGNGLEKKLPMMRQFGRFRYSENHAFQAVVLPYQGNRIAMYVFLPTRRSTLREFEQNLNSAEWEQRMRDFKPVLGAIRLPRFAVSYQTQLNGPLSDLGMAMAFDPRRARFDGISPSPPQIWIGQALHRALAEVNEEGTEAAAVTAMTATLSMAQRPEHTFEMIVNRPFFFVIRDDQTGTILFMGAVNDPE